jgi:hypothetical protein
MKKISALFIAGLITLCFSMSLHAQSSENSLDQAELMKQFVGTWANEFGEDSVVLWKMTPYGNGYEIFVNWKAKGESYNTAKGIAGFTAKKQKVNWFTLFQESGGLSRDLGEFVTEDKFVMERYNFDHSRILMKQELIFLTPDKTKLKNKRRGKSGTWDDAVVFEDTYIRVK